MFAITHIGPCLRILGWNRCFCNLNQITVQPCDLSIINVQISYLSCALGIYWLIQLIPYLAKSPTEVMYIENNVCARVTNRFSAHERVIWCLFPELRSNEGIRYQNNTGVSAKTVRHENKYIILFLTRHNESTNDDQNDEFYTSSPCLTRSVFVLLMTSQSIADGVTMTRQLWCDHVTSDI